MRRAAAVECITQRCGHTTLRFALKARSGKLECAPTIVEIQLFGPVIVGEIDIRPAVAVEVSGRGSQSPSRATDPHLVGHVLELATTQIVKEQILPAIGGELEAVVHDLRRREMPQINVSEIRSDVEIEQAVAVVVEPDRAVAVHPAM